RTDVEAIRERCKGDVAEANEFRSDHAVDLIDLQAVDQLRAGDIDQPSGTALLLLPTSIRDRDRVAGGGGSACEDKSVRAPVERESVDREVVHDRGRIDQDVRVVVGD